MSVLHTRLNLRGKVHNIRKPIAKLFGNSKY